MTYTQRRTFILSYLVTLLLLSLVVLQLGQGVMVALLLIGITAIPPLVMLTFGVADPDVIDTTELDNYFLDVLSIVHATLINTPTVEAAIYAVGKVLLEYDFGLHLETDTVGEAMDIIENEGERKEKLTKWLEKAMEGESIVAHKQIGQHLFTIFTIATLENDEWVVDDELVSVHTTIYAKIMGAK